MQQQASRRTVLALLGAGSAMVLVTACGGPAEAKGDFPVKHTDAEWRKLLTPAQYYILRQAGTERPFTSPLLNEHRKGTFTCAADGNPLYLSSRKYDSGTGWPSFWAPIHGAVGYSSDHSLVYERTEVHCMKCGGHLGHVFNDGPPPTHKRYCMNGDAMKFVVG